MAPKYHILLLEDMATDVEMSLRELRQEGLQFTAQCVMTEAEFRAALRQPTLDLILADYTLPSYDGLSALALAQKERPNVPFIFVSGTLGEETAIDALHQGATDYVLKQRLSRLGPAVQRALREVSERNQRRQAEEKYRDLFEHAREAIILTDLQGNITGANRLVEEYGFTRKELLGTKLFDFVGDDQKARAIADFEILLAGQPVQGEMEVVTPTGVVCVEYRDNPIVRDGQVVGVQAILTDVTERKRAEQQLRDYQQKLRELAARLTLAEEQERRRIAVGVHDQIGQRMALVKLSLQSLRASTAGSTATRVLDEVCEDIDKVIEDTHSLTFELSNPVLHEAGFVNALESLLVEQVRDRHGIQYTFEADPGVVSIEKETGIALFQIMRELLTNIVKHAKAKQVNVRIGKVGDRVWITVHDDGVGFEPPKVGVPDSKAGGYGLFSVRERVEYLGGTFAIDSAPGEGTWISITVPGQSQPGSR